jgi:hypothetical protein
MGRLHKARTSIVKNAGSSRRFFIANNILKDYFGDVAGGDVAVDEACAAATAWVTVFAKSA